ncbi:MAG: toll/interleukin-1 receptor domain-containing protein [Thiobacillus sp.]|nr:toll/interleukin-1 receptor domain-containing protein [Thiobacillus sp.]MDP3126782.1 toll/interleukin-1 receptor domain-containing protein [Thiobacillus sp.]
MQDSVPPKVFLSYSWENDEHKAWVRALAERLTQNGVEVRLDQWHISPGQSLTQFMEAEVSACGFVVVICTKDYARKSLARAGGVGYEQQIITGNIVAGRPRENFIPVVRDGEFTPGPECSIPGPFLGIYAVDMRNGVDADASAELLLRTLYKVPAFNPPAIGSRPSFASQGNGEQEVEDESEEIRLPVLDIDGYHLESGLASHHRWPKTFEIPDESERRGLVDGDIVKLIFDIQVEGHPEFGGISSERMWVIVRGRSGPYYIGELNNVPACSNEQNHLQAGDQVVFLPEHVISIFSRGGAEITVDDDDA